MSSEGEGAAVVDAAIDNDVVFKAICYGLTSALWSVGGARRHIGVLGAARYVLARAIDRADLSHDKASAHGQLAAFFGAAAVLEPIEREIEFAAQMEVVAQREGLFLDVGESQLVAMVVERGIPVFETGDKRAIRAVEQLLDQFEAAVPLRGRVRCLEQLILRLVSEVDRFDSVAQAVCGEPHVDKTMSTCFGCYSLDPASRKSVLEGLMSHIANIRGDAPRVLAP